MARAPENTAVLKNSFDYYPFPHEKSVKNERKGTKQYNGPNFIVVSLPLPIKKLEKKI